MKTLLRIFVFLSLTSCVYSQELILWQRGEKPIKFPTEAIDSMRITPCDTNIYDLGGCDLDIDSTIVNVACGNTVNIQTIFDGSPSYIKYTIYDETGAVIFMAYNTSQLTFTLPGTGTYYGYVEASCGGGEKNGGDEDEDVFEIINSVPNADFMLKSICSCKSGGIKTITTTNYSEGAVSNTWKVTDVATGAVSTFTSAEPTFTLALTKKYNVELVVTDSKGCQTTRSQTIDTATTCKPSFDWWYSWCETCTEGSKSDVVVYFENQSTYANCDAPVTYLWDFGDSTTSTEEAPQHTYIKVPCPGQEYRVRLTITIGLPTDSNYCQSVWDTTVTINNRKVELAVDKICCDGLVFFHTDATKGQWNTPGSMNIPKFPAVSKKIYKALGVQIGQNYRQYYNSVGVKTIVINDAVTEDHNRCPVTRLEFTINKIECLNRNVRIKRDTVIGGVGVKYKLTALALPLIHRVKSKVRTTGFKKVAEISTNFSGTIYKKDVYGCYCDPQGISDAGGGIKYNKRKSKASTSTSGKFRIGMDMVTANFYVKTKGGVSGSWILKIGYPPCDHPWFLYF